MLDFWYKKNSYITTYSVYYCILDTIRCIIITRHYLYLHIGLSLSINQFKLFFGLVLLFNLYFKALLLFFRSDKTS